MTEVLAFPITMVNYILVKDTPLPNPSHSALGLSKPHALVLPRTEIASPSTAYSIPSQHLCLFGQSALCLWDGKQRQNCVALRLLATLQFIGFLQFAFVGEGILFCFFFLRGQFQLIVILVES